MLTDFFQQEWKESKEHARIRELAKKYHEETEAFDRTVCSGPVVRDSIMPIGVRELALVNANARKAFKATLYQAASDGISMDEMRKAIGRYS